MRNNSDSSKRDWPRVLWDHEQRTIEARMVAELDDDDPWVSAACTGLIGSGGKRLRASLLVHCARAGGGAPASTALDGAAAVEMLHLGTLVHDDIADRAVSRRGIVAVHQQWGNWTAALVGARMLVRSTAILAELAPAMRGRFVELVVELCAGQMQDLLVTPAGAAHFVERFQAYLHTVQQKTASLFSFACELGAALGKAGSQRRRLAARWGMRFGVLYQIVDDITDLFGDERVLGKPPGSDLAEGRLSFPWIITELDPEEYREQMRRDPPAALAAARRRVIDAGGLAVAAELARALASEAESVRNGFEGGADSALSEAIAGLLRKLATAHDAATQVSPTSARAIRVLQTTFAELDRRPSIAADYSHEQLAGLLKTRAPDLLLPDAWGERQSASVSLVVRAAADTARAFGGTGEVLAESGRWCALSVELLAGLRDRSYAADCGLLLAGDVAMVHAVGRVLALDLEPASEVLRGLEQAIRRTLRTASPGLPFGGLPIQPVGAELQPLAAAVARVAAHRAGARWAESRAIAELWVLLMELATDDPSRCAQPRHALLSDMRARIGSLSLSEPSVLVASLSSVAPCGNDLGTVA